MIKRVTRKNINLNTLKTGCTPCLNETKIIKRKIGDRKVSELKLEEIKKIIDSFFEKK